MEGSNKVVGLPKNAYRKLEPGEVYYPMVSADDNRAEVTPWSVVTGLVMVLIFSAACIYMAMRAGNAIEASIPIAIMAIFFGAGPKKIKSTILENVMVQSIGQAAGVVAAGAAFLIPALYINRLEPEWWQIFLSCFIGGTLGVVLIIPLRQYFVKDLHGELPFPEATAINEILVSGESTSQSSGKVLLTAFGMGALFDFLVETFHFWNPMMTTKTLLGGFGQKMANLRFEAEMNGLAALFGLGYIIGLRYAAIIAAGSVLAYLVMIPLIYHFGSQIPNFIYAGTNYVISDMSSKDIFDAFVKPIGIGAIAVSGIIGIIRMGGIILGSLSLGFKGLKGGHDATKVARTSRDMDPKQVMLIQIGSVILMAILFIVIGLTTKDATTGETYPMTQALLYGGLGALVGFALSFLFTPVAAQAIAIVGVNPVSGMTLITVVLTILALVSCGLTGTGGMFIALIVGCAVCTALSTSGALITDFKIGYWLGSTPANQQKYKFLGVALASLVVAFVIPIMDSAYHFVVQNDVGEWVSNTDVLPAPQANMIAAVAKGLLSDPANQPWLLYGLGGIMAIVLYMAGVPMLAFALGMYLPISINMPVLFGAFVAWLVARSGKDKETQDARGGQGILIASGLMAGASIFGIFTAILRLPEIGAPIHWLSVGEKFNLITTATGERMLEAGDHVAWYHGAMGQGIGLVMYIVLAIGCFLLAKKGVEMAKAEKN